MRLWILSFFFLATSSYSQACGGWYPFGEEVRFSLFHPQLFDDGGMKIFYYSADYIYYYYEHKPQTDRNVDDWYQLLNGKVTKEDVFEAVYQLTAVEILDKKSKHPFVSALRKVKKEGELQYLAFAKQYSNLNRSGIDHWEREDSDLNQARSEAIGEALKRMKSTKEKQLKRRYAYQAIRFAFYNNDQELIEKLYNDHFKGKSELTIDHWADYYYLHTLKPGAERNSRAAQIFAKVPSKSHGIFYLYTWKIPVDETLTFARSDEEKANVMAMHAVRQKNRQLSTIAKIYELDADHPLLPFLIVRELNKVEDWVLGPKYTTFAPIMRPGITTYEADDMLIERAVISDQDYAKEFEKWLMTNRSGFDLELLASVTGMLQFITDDTSKALNTLKYAKFQNKRREAWRLRMVSLLSVAEGADIEDLDLSRFLSNDHENRERFLFIVGRLFEYKGELGNAALFFSQLNQQNDYWNAFAWNEKRGRTVFNVTFYSDYYRYFDANYSAKELAEILAYVEDLRSNYKGKQLVQLTEDILSEKLRITDLIGTKHLREDDLASAVRWFEKVPEGYWKADSNYYAFYLAANPFYVDFYSQHEETAADTVSYTKYEIASKLDQLIKQVKKQKGDKRAKTEFLIANCYFNMTTHGNSWMMRRSWWSANTYNTIYVDSDEFNKCLKAKDHYLAAYESAKSPMFKALCLRMAGRCESYQLFFDEDYQYDFDYEAVGGYRDYVFRKNTNYKRLKEEFPQYERELITNCYSFNRFYNSI